MSKAWSLVRLDKILQLQRRWLNLNPTEMYTEIGIRSFGKGIFHKTPVLGASLGNKRVLQIQPGDIVFNNVFAWEGAVAVAGEAEAGKIGSHRFVTYTTIGDRCTVEYLRLFFCSQSGLEVLRKVSPGSAGRNRTLNIAQFAKQEIPLPPLKEQLRIVARVEELTGKIDEVRLLRQQALEETKAIFTSAMNQIWSNQSNWVVKPLGELATTVSGQVDPKIEPYASLPHINGEAMESGTCQLLSYRLAKEDEVTSGKFHFHPGSILYSKIRPYLRKAVQVPFEGICSADVYAFDIIHPDLEPRFFMYSLIAKNFTEYANSLSGRTRIPKLNQKQLFAFKMGYPHLLEQRQIIAYLDHLQAKLDEMKQLREQVMKELDALLPSILDKAFKGEL